MLRSCAATYLLPLLLSMVVSTSASWAAPVTDQRLKAAAADADNWLSYGKDYREQRYSPLDRINADNVGELGLSWFLETDSTVGMEATPLVADGVMYVSAGWSVVYALDAVTGRQLWKFDPQVPREVSYRFCCGAINRGVALWGDRVFVGTLDGRLVAIDAGTGEQVWSVQTTPLDQNYSITGAPRVVNGKVIIGNGGSEYGVRGFVTAYDAATGEQVWRFYTVPGNPADGFENDAMARAADTWKGEWWKLGGGGTVWDAIAFDPELNLLYLGVGNGAPHNQNIRSPGGGDNLYLSSIVALNPDTGEYVWHYQQVPGETWDYTATQQMSLVDIEWQGQTRKVIMQAPKAGFFYLIDRVTGELLSAEPYVTVSWASHYDLQTGRPVENPGQRALTGPSTVFPTSMGGHNWQPMAYSPQTGLMYIPALDFGSEFVAVSPENYVQYPRHWNLGYEVNAAPLSQPLQQAVMRHLPRAYLLAWDPIAQREVWRADHPYMHPGGVLATAGNLVFQGRADGRLLAYRADDGTPLWDYAVQNGVLAAPISYAVDGEQYIAVAVGRGGALSMTIGIDHAKAATPGRVMVFKLGGEAQLPPPPPALSYPEPPPRMDVSEEQIERGRSLYNSFCGRCHGFSVVSDGSIPDLRHLPAVWHENFDKVVRQGMMERAGMPRFDDVLSAEDARLVHAYIIERAHEDQADRNRSDWWRELRSTVYQWLVNGIDWLMRRDAGV